MDKEIKNEENLPKYSIPRNLYEQRNLPLPPAFFTPEQLSAMFHHFQIKQQDGMRFPPDNWELQQEFFKNENLNNELKPEKTIKEGFEKVRKKKISKRKEKIDFLKQINPSNIVNLKKTNLKNTYINKIHHLITDEEAIKDKWMKESNSDSESETNQIERSFFAQNEEMKKTKSMINLPQTLKNAQSCQSNMKDLDQPGKNNVKLEKNRESARNSRKRKKIYIMLLENKVSDLTKEIKDMKKETEEKNNNIKLKFNSKTMDGFLTEKQYLLEKVETLLKQNIDPNEINLLLDSFTFRFGSTGKERLIAINYFIKQLINIMIPNHMKFLMNWSNDMDLFNGKKRFKISEKTGSEISLQLLLDTSEEQKQLFFKHQKKLILEKQFYDQIICNLHNLKKLMYKSNENLQTIFDDIRTIFTPSQTAKFILTLDKEKDMTLYPDSMWNQLSQIDDFDDVSGKIEKLEEMENGRERHKNETMLSMNNKRNMSVPDNMQNYTYPNLMDLQQFIYNTQNEFPNLQMLGGSNLDMKDQKDFDLTMYLFKELNENLIKK